MHFTLEREKGQLRGSYARHQRASQTAVEERKLGAGSIPNSEKGFSAEVTQKVRLLRVPAGREPEITRGSPRRPT